MREFDPQLTVYVHAVILRRSWSKLWYLCRALDDQGRGYLQLNFEDLCKWTLGAESTVYQWLRTAKQQGAIRYYKRDRDTISIYLGSLYAVCLKLGIDDWGTTAEVNLRELIMTPRQVATAITAQKLQQQSCIAARRSLKTSQRKIFKQPSPNDIVKAGHKHSCPKSDKRETHLSSVFHVGKSKAFVGQTFIPVGVSQDTIGFELTISDRTVRRHLADLDVDRRQIVQSKPEYQQIALALDYESDEYVCSGGGIETVWMRRVGDQVRLYEPNGISSSRRKNGYTIKRDRIFRYRGKDWIYRCNVYDLSHELRTTRTAKRKFKRLKDKVNNPTLLKTITDGAPPPFVILNCSTG